MNIGANARGEPWSIFNGLKCSNHGNNNEKRESKNNDNNNNYSNNQTNNNCSISAGNNKDNNNNYNNNQTNNNCSISAGNNAGGSYGSYRENNHSNYNYNQRNYSIKNENLKNQNSIITCYLTFAEQGYLLLEEDKIEIKDIQISHTRQSTCSKSGTMKIEIFASEQKNSSFGWIIATFELEPLVNGQYIKFYRNLSYLKRPKHGWYFIKLNLLNYEKEKWNFQSNLFFGPRFLGNFQLKFIKNVSYSIENNKMIVKIDKLQFLQRPNCTSGPIKVKIFATDKDFDFDNSKELYCLGKFKLKSVEHNTYYYDLKKTILFSPPQEGFYFITLVLQSYNNLKWIKRDQYKFTNNIRLGYFQLTFKNNLSYSIKNDKVIINIDKLTFFKQNNCTSGTIKVELCATYNAFDDSPEFHRLGKIRLDPLKHGECYNDLKEEVDFFPPKFGLYYITLVLRSYNNGEWIYQDKYEFKKKIQLGKIFEKNNFFSEYPVKNSLKTNSESNIQFSKTLKIAEYLWPKAQIYYKIDNKISTYLEILIENAIEIFTNRTCLTFNKFPNKDYILFKPHYNSCYSSVGRQGGEQIICLANWAKLGNVMHEIMHALGFNHEHCRIDRDEYVRFDNNKKPFVPLNNYEIEGYPIGKYDPSSIMHYSLCDFMTSNNSKAKEMGQRNSLTENDIKAIQFLYTGPKCSFDHYGKEYLIQTYFECFTCFGKYSNYGVCTFCASECHSTHEILKHDYNEITANRISMFCDCGFYKHKFKYTKNCSLKYF